MILGLLMIYATLFAFGSSNSETLEGIWTSDGQSGLEISFCDGVATSNLQLEDGSSAPIEVPYQVVGGNAALYILEYQLTDIEQFVLNVSITADGITIESMDCKVSPETCQGAIIAMYQTLSHQNPEIDVDNMIQGLSGVDFSTLDIGSASYVYSRACDTQTQ